MQKNQNSWMGVFISLRRMHRLTGNEFRRKNVMNNGPNAVAARTRVSNACTNP